jgi:hypothetical protein
VVKAVDLHWLRTVDAHDALVPKTIASLPETPELAKTSGKCSTRPDRALTKPITETFSTDPDLARIVVVWPQLPEYIRRAILALVESKD